MLYQPNNQCILVILINIKLFCFIYARALNNITKLSSGDARDVLVGLASSVENFNAVQDLIVAQGVNLEQNL